MTKTPRFAVTSFVLLCFAPAFVAAQDANQIVRRAVQSELAASHSDHTRWRYRDEQRDAHTVSIVVETDRGSVKRLIEKDGHPLSRQEREEEEDRIQALIHDPAKLARQKKDAEQDDKNATELLNMLPDAFTWRISSDAGEAITVDFTPNPNFHPPDMQSRVLGAMGGQLVVDKRQQRIRTIKGKLLQDVMIGFGILGRLHEGGTFNVERREVKPGLWQITETRVNINGKALFFKTISEHQDEVQSDFRVVPGSNTLEQAAELSQQP